MIALCYWQLKATLIKDPDPPHQKLYSTSSSVEHVRVPCASAGDVTVSLHNISKSDTTTPLVIIIPPFSHPDQVTNPDLVPSCFRDYPTAVIHYRWQPTRGSDRPVVPLHWPTPLHDVSFGYSWLVNNLGSNADSGSPGPRPAYVYGSYLGASLAAGLALTESHLPDPSHSMVVRGLIAHNGIYNWTMFLPDHPIHKPKSKRISIWEMKQEEGPTLFRDADLDRDNTIHIEEPGIFTTLKHQAPSLFVDPGNLFDPFASACLFFHSPSLHVPDDFTTPLEDRFPPPESALAAAIDALSSGSNEEVEEAIALAQLEPDSSPRDEESAAEFLARAAALAKLAKPPRMGYLVFPPRHSTLRLPCCLFLHDRPRGAESSSSSSSTPTEPRVTKAGNASAQASLNNFTRQSQLLSSFLLRSLDMHELRRSPPWDPDRWKQLDEQQRELRRQRFIQRLRRRESSEPSKVAQDEQPLTGLYRRIAEEKAFRLAEMERRVQTFETEPRHVEVEGDVTGMGMVPLPPGLDEVAEGVVAEWLRERIGEDEECSGR
ncbi:hypothetical protein VTJ49DRAFT_574 [Mycothermus thermophilus]|uniref:Alpha/beta-hydrolase n=1 Tax=Humicola insolens TaxID=85995 RepID=A0ABR3VEY5_HUMIN